MKLRYWTFELPFKNPFTTSWGTKTHQPTLIVELEVGNFRGYGEATAISYYNVTIESMVADLEKKKTFVEKFAMTDPERYWHYLHHLFPDNPFLVCALDMAGWDLFGKMRGKPLHELWNTEMENIPGTNFTIGLDTIDNMVGKMRDNPWPAYKVKLGSENDIKIMEELRKHTDAVLRVDANSGWNLKEALERITVLHILGVEFIEQPLKKDDWDGMKVLYEQSPIPLIADESCVFENDIDKCIGHFHAVNIKLTKCSGITPARRMITKLRIAGMQVMMGCMNESSIGSGAIVQFLPQLDYVDVDGPLLLLNDLATGVQYGNGFAKPSSMAGLGILPTFL